VKNGLTASSEWFRAVNANDVNAVECMIRQQQHTDDDGEPVLDLNATQVEYHGLLLHSSESLHSTIRIHT